MSVKNHRYKLAALATVLFLAGPYFLLPYALKPSMEVAIRGNGFPKAKIGVLRFLRHGVYIDRIDLDPNGFTALESIEVRGSWKDIIFERKIDRLTIKNLVVTGEIDTANRVTIAGWNGQLPSGEAKKDQTALPFNYFSLEGATLDFDTPIGALRFQGKATLNGKQLLASVVSAQRQLSTTIDMVGSFNDDGSFSGKADIQDTGIVITPFEVARLTGWIDFTSGLKSAFAGQIVAGGMKSDDIPFEDINLAFDTAQSESAVFRTKITGQDIFFTGHSTHQPQKLTLEVSAPSIESLVRLVAPDTAPNDWLDEAGPVSLTARLDPLSFVQPKLGLNAVATLKKRNMTLSSDMVYDRAARILSGTIRPVVFKATDLQSVLPLDEKFQTKLSSGTIKLEGAFRADLSKTPAQISGPVNLSPATLDGEAYGYAFTGLAGKIDLESLYPWSIQSGRLALKSFDAGKVFSNLNIRFDGNQSNLNVKGITSQLAGGIFSVPPFIWRQTGKSNSLVLELKNIKLAKLMGEDEQAFVADGSVSGEIPIRFSNDGPVIEHAVLRSDGPASFKYAPKQLPASLQGDDPRLQTARLALSDYHYDTLEIRLDGELNGNLKTPLSAKGSSPAVDGRPVNLNLNLEGALASALRQALQPGQLASKLEQQLSKGKR